MQIIDVSASITITQIKEDDLETLITCINDHSIYRNTLSVPYPYNQSDGRTFIRQVLDFESVHERRKDWAIRNEKSELIGGIGLLYEQGLDAHRSELGYWLASDYRNQGIMTRVISAFVNAVFLQTDIIRIDAHVFTDNPASARVLEKAGFEKEGLLRKAFSKDNTYKDAWLFATLRD